MRAFFRCADLWRGDVHRHQLRSGQGPLQMTFARSVEPILPVEISITRMATTTGAEQKKRAEGEARTNSRTMGRKHIVPYGLYVAHGEHVRT
nr:type I CRISPR-associated protein Cas7 [Rhodobacter capsulatus]